jgi:hypothetical protein
MLLKEAELRHHELLTLVHMWESALYCSDIHYPCVHGVPGVVMLSVSWGTV